MYTPRRYCSKGCAYHAIRSRGGKSTQKLLTRAAIGPQVLLIREMYDSGAPMKDIMARFGMSTSAVQDTLKRSGPYTPRGIEFCQKGLAKAQAANRLKFDSK